MKNERTITVPANATVTITLPLSEGKSEAKAKAKAKAKASTQVRKAIGLNQLYCVSYTSQAGNQKTYGVFWEGMKNGVRRVGLRPMLANGTRMVKKNRYNKASGGFFVDASSTKRVNR